MKKIIIALLSLCILLCGCRERQISIAIEIPKDYAITKELRKIKELESKQKKASDASTSSISPTVFLPIVQKILSEVLKSQNKKDKIVYRAVIYDNDTVEGEYKLQIEDLTVEVKVKKEKRNER